MKKLLIITVLLSSIVGFSQNKNAKAILEVDGVCMMCKKRIEKACFKSKGVKSAIWNVETKQLQLIYDERKTNLSKIADNLANIGHDNEFVKAPKEAYNNLHHCCKYRDDEVIEEHGKD